MPSSIKNPVEQRLDILQKAWLEATQQHDVPAFIWHMDDDADDFIHAFTAMQQHTTHFATPDLFIKFKTPFDTQFGYCAALRNELIEYYANSREDLVEQGIAADWRCPESGGYDAIESLLLCLASFADYYQSRLRYLVVMLHPDSVSLPSSLHQWMQRALAQKWPANLRIMLVQCDSNPAWQTVIDANPQRIHVISPQLQQHLLLPEIVSQSTEDNDTFLYRRYMTDSMMLLKSATPQQVEERSVKALALAEKKGWPEQEVVVHSLMAGAWLKTQSIPQAVKQYQKAQQRAASIAVPAIKHQLNMQSLFGEAGARLTGRQYRDAADCYLRAAQAAMHIPHKVYAIEGYRMAGFCHQNDGNTVMAVKLFIDAVQIARSLPQSDRAFSTLPVVLQSLLSLQDAARVAKLEAIAKKYQQRLELIQNNAEQRALKLGSFPDPGQLQQLNEIMELTMEEAFADSQQQRETLIRQAGTHFQRIIFAGRELLTSHWNGLPAIAHPLDKMPEEWSTPPSFITPEPHAVDHLIQQPDVVP